VPGVVGVVVVGVPGDAGSDGDPGFGGAFTTVPGKSFASASLSVFASTGSRPWANTATNWYTGNRAAPSPSMEIGCTYTIELATGISCTLPLMTRDPRWSSNVNCDAMSGFWLIWSAACTGPKIC